MFNENQSVAEELEKASDEEVDEEVLTTPESSSGKFSVKVTSTPVPRLRAGRKENFFFTLTCNGVELTERIPVKLQWDAHARIEIKPPREMAFNGCAIFNTPVKSISKEPVRSHCFEMMNGNPEHLSRIEWDFRE
jgi:hypothetical protein